MRGKSKSISLASTFLILAVMTFSLCYVQGNQANPPSMHSPLLIPPPPSAPYWTYTTSDAVRTVAVSADGNTVVAGCNDYSIYVFGRSSNTTLWKYKTNDMIRSVAVSDDGNTIVAGSFDNKVYVFAESSNATLWTYTTSGDACTVAVSGDGNTIVAGSDDNKVYVFGRSSNATLWTYMTAGDVRGVAVSADGNTIVAGSLDNTIRAFGKSSNATLWNYTTSSDVYGVAVSSDGNTIAAGGADSYIRAFGRSSNATLWTYDTTGTVYSVAVSRDGTTIAAGSADDHLRVFARTSNTTLIDCNTGYPVYRSAAVSSSGSTIVCGNYGGSNSKVFLFNRTIGQIWNYTVAQSIGGSSTNSGPCSAISADGCLSAHGGSDKIFVFQYDMVPPSLSSPTVTPSSPVSGQSINISISVTDNLGVSTVTLYYKIAGAVSWSSVSMSLSGAVYKATIGPYSAGANVSYYITAADTSANTASQPASAPTSFYTLIVGEAGLSLMTIALIGGVVAIIVIIAVVLLMRRGKGRRK